MVGDVCVLPGASCVLFVCLLLGMWLLVGGCWLLGVGACVCCVCWWLLSVVC